MDVFTCFVIKPPQATLYHLSCEVMHGIIRDTMGLCDGLYFRMYSHTRNSTSKNSDLQNNDCLAKNSAGKGGHQYTITRSCGVDAESRIPSVGNKACQTRLQQIISYVRLGISDSCRLNINNNE